MLQVDIKALDQPRGSFVLIGQLDIVNLMDHPQRPEHGRYRVEYVRWDPQGYPAGRTARAVVEDHVRAAGALPLVARAILALDAPAPASPVPEPRGRKLAVLLTTMERRVAAGHTFTAAEVGVLLTALDAALATAP